MIIGGKKKTTCCIVCNEIFSYYPSEKSGKYCSRKCAGQINIKNLKERFKGKVHKKTSIEKMKVAQLGYKHHRWTGSIGTYKALHLWVNRHKGQLKYCEHCGTTNTNETYDWANISQLYKRDLNDYMRLCRKCHRKYDTNTKPKP